MSSTLFTLTLLSLSIPLTLAIPQLNVNAEPALSSAFDAIQANPTVSAAIEGAIENTSIQAALLAVPTTNEAGALVTDLGIIEGAVTGSAAPVITSAFNELVSIATATGAAATGGLNAAVSTQVKTAGAARQTGVLGAGVGMVAVVGAVMVL